MRLLASYIKGQSLFKKDFKDMKELEEFNKANSIKNHNLHEIYDFEELLGDGYIVTIEGDEDLYDEEFADFLHKQKNYKLLNNIYDQPDKLLELKGLEVDILVIQSTGVRHEDALRLQKWYIRNIGNFPKKIICVFGEEYEMLSELIKKSPFGIEVLNLSEVKDEKCEIIKWVGANSVKTK